jgi:HAAS domain-containing protein
MNDREFENYLALLSGMLRLRRTQQSDIAGELRDHLIEHVAELERRGVPHQQAVREALEEFGDAAALAASFSALVRARRRRLIMRCTIGTSLVLAGLMIGVFAFRPPVENDSNVAQAQQGAGETTKSTAKERGKEDKAARDLDQATREELKKIADVQLNEIPLKDVLEHLSDKHNVQFFIDFRSLNEASIPIDSPVTLNLKRVPAEMLLELMLHQLQLGYTVRNGLIIVSTEEALANRAEVRVYKVPDGGAEELAQLIPATIEPHSWRFTPVPAGLIGGGAVGGGYIGGMMPGMAGPQGIGTPATGGEASGMPSGLGGAGMGGFGGLEDSGGVGSIRVFRGVLVVSQTPEVHQKIEKLLDDLDKVLPPQSQSTSTGMTNPDAAPGYGRMPAPQGTGYPGASTRTPRYPGQGGPQYPGQNVPGGAPDYRGAGAPRYPQSSTAPRSTGEGESASPPIQPESGSGQTAVVTESAPSVFGEAADVEPSGPARGGSTTKEPPRETGGGTNTKEPPLYPGKQRN